MRILMGTVMAKLVVTSIVEESVHAILPHDWSNSTTMCLARGRASRGAAL